MENKTLEHEIICPQCNEEFISELLFQIGEDDIGFCECPNCDLHFGVIVDEKKVEQDICKMISEPI